MQNKDMSNTKKRDGRCVSVRLAGRFNDWYGEEPECDAGKRTENMAVSFASWKENGQ